MKSCVAVAVATIFATFSGCAASNETAGASPCTTARAAARPQAGIECPMCFTIIEYMRSGPRHQTHEQVTMQCERCCETLRFTTDAAGQLWVATKANPTPMPCDLCAPAPPR